MHRFVCETVLHTADMPTSSSDLNLPVASAIAQEISQ